MTRLFLVNPNTSDAATDRIAAVARAAAAAGTRIDAVSAPFGVAAIEGPDDMAIAERAVLAALDARAGAFDAAIVAAFSDPALDAARARLAVPVVGIAEAAMLAAAAGGRRFAIVTLGADMPPVLRALAARYGVDDCLTDIVIVPGGVAVVAADLDAAVAVFAAAARGAVDNTGAEAVIIGGGPLSGLATRLNSAPDSAPADSVPVPIIAADSADSVPVPIIEGPIIDGVAAAVRRAERLVAENG